VLALDNMIGADQSTGSGFGDAADASRSGRAGMDTVVNDTSRGVAAVAPSTGTAAGKRQLVDHLQSQLDRAKGLLKVSEQRNIMLANLIRSGAAGYSGAPRMGGMNAGIPMAGTPITGGISSGVAPTNIAGGLIPNLTALTRLTSTHGHLGPDRPGLTLHSPVAGGPGADTFRAAVRHGLDIKGITNPVARANWETGMMVAADRESGFNNSAVNNWDSNAAAGDASAGALQFTGGTFAEYHEPGTSTDRSDNVAEVCAFINYATRRYGVAADGSDLAAKIQQADPTRPAKGY
jgi:hypothetical protein